MHMLYNEIDFEALNIVIICYLGLPDITYWFPTDLMRFHLL
jgi:hypothetical protein